MRIRIEKEELSFEEKVMAFLFNKKPRNKFELMTKKDEEVENAFEYDESPRALTKLINKMLL